MTLKIRFLEAVSSGDLGEFDDSGVIVTLRQFKDYFKDVKSDYVNSFLPAAVIEAGQHSATHTKFLFRVRKGVYRVHPDAMDAHLVTEDLIDKDLINDYLIEENLITEDRDQVSIAALAPDNQQAEADSTSEMPAEEIVAINKQEDLAEKDLNFPEIDTESNKKPDYKDRIPASQMNNKVEEAMMQYMTYRLN